MIDLHTHLHPPRLFAAIRRWFADNTDWDIGRHPTDPHEIAAQLRAAGVDRFVFCSYAHKRGIAADLNAWLVAASRALDGYGLPLATVHLDDPDYLGDLRRALDAGCVGLKIHEDVQRFAVDDARFAPVYAELAARGCFVLAHVGPIPWTFSPGAGFERVARVLARHPQLPFVVAHFGAPDSARYLGALAVHPNLHLDTTMAFAPDSPMRVRGAVTAQAVREHAGRIVYGTDFPNTMYAYESEARGLRSLGLGEEAERAILHDNAARLLQQAGAPHRVKAARAPNPGVQ